MAPGDSILVGANYLLLKLLDSILPPEHIYYLFQTRHLNSAEFPFQSVYHLFSVTAASMVIFYEQIRV
jgi:hypothetical protein